MLPLQSCFSECYIPCSNVAVVVLPVVNSQVPVMEERIRYLLRQYENNKCSREELEELFRHIRNSRNSIFPLKRAMKKMYEDIRKNHPSFSYVNESGQLVVLEPEQHVAAGRERSAEKRNRLRMWIALFAGVVVVSVLWWMAWKSYSDTAGAGSIHPDNITRVSSGRGVQKYLMLPGRSEIWLSSSSSIVIPDTVRNGKLEVFLQGEAYFRVGDLPGTRLIVRTGKLATTLLENTDVNVKAYPGTVSVVFSVESGTATIAGSGQILVKVNQHQSVEMDTAGIKWIRRAIKPNEAGEWRKLDLP